MYLLINMLSKELIKEYQKIYKKEFGEEISEKEAEEQWNSGALVKYMADVVFDKYDKVYRYQKDAYLGESLKHKKVVKVDKWL